MVSLAILSAMLGVLLGLTFRVFILIPTAVLTLVGLAGIGAASEAGACWMFVLDIAIIAAIFGFGGVAVAAAGIAKLLFFIFLVVFVITLITGLTRRGRTPACAAAHRARGAGRAASDLPAIRRECRPARARATHRR